MICHHYKCIFVHIPKNAGQSIERIFLDLLNLTWDTRAPLLLRYNDRPELGPPRLAHLKADEYVRYRYVSPEMFASYFKFAFVRNPWSRMVSMYKYLGFDKKREFKTFLMNDFKNDLYKKRYWFVGPQSEFLRDEHGDLIVDFVGRFENLQNDFNRVCEQIGLPPTDVPHVNKSRDKTSDPREMAKHAMYSVFGKKLPAFRQWQDYYDDETIDFVAHHYKTDIELFGYKFD